MQVMSLSDLIEDAGEETTKGILSCFCISRNPDVERFIRNLAIPYEKSHNARTFLFLNDNRKPLGFVALSLTSLRIPDGISSNLERKLKGYGRFSSDNIPCYLIGQLARFDAAEKDELSGNDIFSIVSDYVKESQNLFGGRVVSIDCADDLVQYYEKRGFVALNKIEDLNQMVYLIKDIKDDLQVVPEL